MELERLARKAREATGLEHKIQIDVLRHYLKTTSQDELIREVEKITDAELLRTLWEAGLSRILQEAVLEQLRELT